MPSQRPSLGRGVQVIMNMVAGFLIAEQDSTVNRGVERSEVVATARKSVPLMDRGVLVAGQRPVLLSN